MGSKIKVCIYMSRPQQKMIIMVGAHHIWCTIGHRESPHVEKNCIYVSAHQDRHSWHSGHTRLLLFTLIRMSQKHCSCIIC